MGQVIKNDWAISASLERDLNGEIKFLNLHPGYLCGLEQTIKPRLTEFTYIFTLNT